MTDTKEPWIAPLAKVLCCGPMACQYPDNCCIDGNGALGDARRAYAELQRQGLIRTPGTVEVCDFAMPNRHGGQRCNNQRIAGYDCLLSDCPLKGAP